MSRTVSWCLLVVWSAWIFAFQGVMASSPEVSSWTPELGVVLLLALDPRLDRSDALLALCIVAGAAISFSSDSPLAILVGYAAVVIVARQLRSIVEIDRLFPRALLAGASAALLTIYWGVTRSVLFASEGISSVPLAPDTRRLLHGALATALAAAVLAPLLVRLPGMSPLRGRAR